MDLSSAKAGAKKWGIRAALIVALAPPPLFALYTYGALHYTYSDGERVGYVQKLSKKGWLCKTNEGELAMVQMPGQPATNWNFTVRSDEAMKQIDELHGHKVVLHYEEHRGLPTSCFGETEYFVTGARRAE
jgi:hypothetical protein